MNRPTDPPIHPPIHLSKGGSVSTNHKSSNRIELSWLDQVLLKFLWFHMFWPTNPPIHPPKKTPTHGWGSLHRFQIFKRNWIILIRSSFIVFLLIWGLGVGGGNPHTCKGGDAWATHVHVRMRVWHHREFPMGYPNFNGSSHLHEIIMFIVHTCTCACVHVCMCRRACVGVAPTHPHPHSPTQPPTNPQRGVTPKTVKFQYVLN